MAIFANTSGKDSVRNAFLIHARDVHRVALAAPFFSYAELLRPLADGERQINLIVRLGAATSADALKQALALPGVNIRFYTSSLFHSKLYIFGDKMALVGSANLTQSGLQSNREVVVEVPRANPDFDDLVSVFQSYWSEADVLDEDRLATYAKLWSLRDRSKSPDDAFDERVRQSMGDVAPSQGVQVGVPNPSADRLYLEDYRRTYQGFLSAFREVEALYEADGRRQQPGLPLRIEIDQFFSFVRETHCPGDSYKEAPPRPPEERRRIIKEMIAGWFDQRWDWLDDHVVEAYPRIQRRFGTKQAIQTANTDEILEGLEVCHAFSEMLRFHLGGAPTLRKEFAAGNDLVRVKNTLSFLIHGKDPFVDRMGAAIFDPQYKLAKFGRSVVQELLGWVNGEDIPICNGRTLKTLRFLGFDVAVPGA